MNDTIKRIQYEIEQSKIHGDKGVKLDIVDVESLINGVETEREACAKVCEYALAQSKNALFRSGLKIAIEEIRSRSK